MGEKGRLNRVVVVGSVAFDDLQTPFGAVTDSLGGSATYFSLSARLFADVGMVAVVGTDFPAEHIDMLVAAGVDTSGLQVAEGKTFRWKGRYDQDLNTAHTLDTQLNVFAGFRPELSDSYRQADVVFTANIDPGLQIEVLRQVSGANLRVLDTMNFWIEGKRTELVQALGMVDVALLNEAEARQLAQTHSLVGAARVIREMGPRTVVVKRGEYGAVLFSDDGCFIAPAYPLENVKDPTGAGDSFAGGFVGYLCGNGVCDDRNMRRAVVMGSVVASFTVEGFGVERLQNLTLSQVHERYRDFSRFTRYAELD